MKKWYWYIIIAAFLFLILYKNKGMLELLKAGLKKWEGFISHPKWDYKQWSWGYGTQVPDSVANPSIKPILTSITPDKAMDDAIKFALNRQKVLKKYITKPLSEKQWAALLLFDYNTGSGTKLATNINSNNKAALKNQWLAYNIAGGSINSWLVSRRNYEWQLYNS